MKMRSKIRVLASVLISIATLLLAGCAPATTTQHLQPGGTSIAATSKNPQVMPTTAETTLPTTEAKTQTRFYNGNDFSDGVAWVQRDASGWECIDENGMTLFALDAGSKPSTDFIQGAAIVESLDSNGQVTKKIVAKDGAVVFPKADGYQYYFDISYGQYNFVTRKINTFEKTETQTGIVDNMGKWVIEPTPELTVNAFNSMTSMWNDHGLITAYYQGKNCYDANMNQFFVIENRNDAELVRRTVEHLYSEELCFLVNQHENIYNDSSDFILRIPHSYGTSYGMDLTSIGFVNSGTGFYNRAHQLAIDLSTYNEPYAIGGFSGGYCAMNVKNPQGSSFFTVIDLKGNRVFEPVPCNSQFFPVSCGRILVSPANEEPDYYIDVHGKTVIANIDEGTTFCANGLARVISKNPQTKGVYYIDIDGNIVF